MIPMACPNCGRRGSVPPDKLNSRLHCKKCDAIFHMDHAGHVVLGEPGVPAKPGGASGVFTVPGKDSGQYGKAPSGVHPAAGHAAATATRPAAGARTELPGIWESLPRAVKLALAGGLALVLLWALGVRLPGGGPAPPPTLEGRIGYVAGAFAYNEPANLRKLAASGTGGDAAAWLAKLHPLARLGARRQVGYQSGHTMKIVSGGGPTDSQARVMVVVRPPVPKFPDNDAGKGPAELARRTRLLTDAFAAGPLPDGSFILPMVWKSRDGAWWLDGAETLRAASTPPPATDEPAAKRAP